MPLQAGDGPDTTSLTADGGLNGQPVSEIRRVFQGKENTEIDVPLGDILDNDTLLLYPEVVNRNYFRIYLRKTKLVFQAAGYIGLIPVNPKVAIEVKSRVPIANLERILRISEHSPVPLSPHLRTFDSHDEPLSSLIDIFTEALLSGIDAVRDHGRLREYHSRQELTAFPKGRILINRTVTARAATGLRHRVAAAWFDRTADNAPNRCLKYAVWLMANKYSGIDDRTGLKRMVSRLNIAYNDFDGIKLDHSQSFLNDPVVKDSTKIPAVRHYYAQALGIAKLIISGHGIALSRDGYEVTLSALIINMETAFENYLRQVLISGLESQQDVTVLDGNKSGDNGAKKPLFDGGIPNDIKAEPDIVLARLRATNENDKYPLVLEAKYTVIDKLAKREHINQTIAYGASYKAKNAIIVYPGNLNLEPGLSLLGKLGPLNIHQYVFDLGNSDMESVEKNFCEKISTLI